MKRGKSMYVFENIFDLKLVECVHEKRHRYEGLAVFPGLACIRTDKALSVSSTVNATYL
jgi:hypothetical protein